MLFCFLSKSFISLRIGLILMLFGSLGFVLKHELFI